MPLTPTIYVRNGGNDANNGSSDALAVATIQRAQELASAGSVIGLKYGSVWKGITGINKSGTAMNPINWIPYGDDSLPLPEITGFYDVPSWTDIGGGLYRHTVSGGLDPRVNSLSFDNAQKPRGVWPKEGYNTITGASGAGSGTISDSANLDASQLNLTGGWVIFKKLHWILDKAEITAHSGSTLSYSNTSSYNAQVNYGYKVDNKREFCTELGEWTQEGDDIIMFFGANNPDNYKVRVAQDQQWIDQFGLEHNIFEKIKFTGFNGVVQRSANDGITHPSCSCSFLRRCKGLRFDLCEVEHMGQTFIYTENYEEADRPEGFRYYGCKFRKNNNTLHWMRHGEADVKVTGCTIEDHAMFPGAGSNGDGSYNTFMFSTRTFDVEFQHNYINNVGFNGVIAQGVKFLFSHNRIFSCANVKADSGGIYHENGPTVNANYNINERIIERNHIFAGPGTLEGMPSTAVFANEGIYIDDSYVVGQDCSITIRHNLLRGNAYGVKYHNTSNHKCHDNIMFDNFYAGLNCQNDTNSGQHIRNIEFYDNVVVSFGDQRMMRLFEISNSHSENKIEDIFSLINNNNYIYANPDTKEFTRLTLNTGSGPFSFNRTFSEWKTDYPAYDPNSSLKPSASNEFFLYLNDTEDDNVEQDILRKRLDVDGVEVTELFLNSFTWQVLVDDLGPLDPEPTIYPLTAAASPEAAGSVSVDPVSPHEVGAQVTVTATPNSGWTFDKWQRNGVDQQEPNPWILTRAAQSESIVAVFEEIPPETYALTLNVSGNGTAIQNPESPHEEGTNVELSATPDSGNQFDGWYDGETLLSTNNPYSYTTLAEEKTIIGTFSVVPPETYTVTLNANNGGAVSQLTTGPYEEGDLVQVQSTPNSGYRFLRWEIGGDEVSTDALYSFNMPGENLSLTAVFELIPTYTISLSVDPAGSGTTSQNPSNPIQEGSTVQINVNPVSGKQFVRWRNGSETFSTANPHTFEVTEALSLVAELEDVPPNEYTLSLSINPEGAGTVTGAGTHPEGSTVELIATSNQGWTFAYWMRGTQVISNQAEFQYTMPSENTSLLAFFETTGPSSETTEFYSLNQIPLADHGILPGKQPNSSIAIAGIFDFPERTGKTYHSWGDQHGIQPYIRADEIFFAGRDISLMGFVKAQNETEAIDKVLDLYQEIDAFNHLVLLTCKWGAFWVHVVDEITAQYISRGYFRIRMVFREPVPDLTGTLPTGDSQNPGIDGVEFKDLGLLPMKGFKVLNRSGAKQASYISHSQEGYGRKKRGLNEYTLSFHIQEPSFVSFLGKIRGLYEMMKSPGLRTLRHMDGTYREVFVKDGFSLQNIKHTKTYFYSRINISFAEVRLLRSWNVLTDNLGNVLVDNHGAPLFFEVERPDFVQVVAIGGVVTDVEIDGVDWVVHTFPESGEFEVIEGGEIEYLIVGGGGGGGSRARSGGGGGAGDVIQAIEEIGVGIYSVTIGNGGAGGASSAALRGENGGDTVFNSQTAIGGGGGGASVNISSGAGRNGSSGGGGGQGSTGGSPGIGGVAQGINGHNGGNAFPIGQATQNDLDNRAGGGGGGAGGPGGNASFATGGIAGLGIQLSISGTTMTYAKGGRGGSATETANETAPNTGDGGDGSHQASFSEGKNGGSGVVIIRYRKY
ncbi:InlB B-repeat-containing protein [Pleomorphovibrio marinus]|uniref:InlB B-repeat-containing protein n=1 Tax=Pleomorphovibrio marinus TaxID=2164132 RepID=UPI0013007A20|nr:InlB B-repeat-containing protein [Pleomorphovibrio marinus]